MSGSDEREAVTVATTRVGELSGVSGEQWLEPFCQFPVFVSGVNRPIVGVAKEPNRIEFEEFAEFCRMGSELTIVEGDAPTDRSIVTGEGYAQSRTILPGRKVRGDQASAFERALSQSGTPLLIESSGIALWVSNDLHRTELSPTYRRLSWAALLSFRVTGGGTSSGR